MHRLMNAVSSVGRPLATKALQRTFASSSSSSLSSLVKSQKPAAVRVYSTPATSVVAEPFLNGTSSTYVEEMYESWLENPNSVHKVMYIFARIILLPLFHLTSHFDSYSRLGWIFVGLLQEFVLKAGALIHMGQGGHVPRIFGLGGHYHECPPQYF